MSWAVAQLALLRPDPGNAPERRLELTLRPWQYSLTLNWSRLRIWGNVDSHLTGKKNVFLCSHSVSTRKVSFLMAEKQPKFSSLFSFRGFPRNTSSEQIICIENPHCFLEIIQEKIIILITYYSKVQVLSGKPLMFDSASTSLKTIFQKPEW